MQILMISDVYFPRINGVSTSIASFREALEQLGHKVTLICPSYPDQTCRAEICQGDIGQTKGKTRRATDAGIQRVRSRMVPGDPEDRMMFYREIIAKTAHLKAHDLDIIHVHTPFVAHYAGLAIARRLKVPLVASYHTLFEEYLEHYVRWLPAPWMRFAARRFSRHQCHQLQSLVVPSGVIEDALRGYGVTTPIRVIASGLNLSRFTRQVPDVSDAALRQAHGLPEDARLLVFVGRVAYEKNIDFLIRMLPTVLARHASACLVIVGEGPARQSLEQLVAEQGLQASVVFVGYLDREGPLQAMIRAAEAFVFASRTETQGLVLLEALALGTPVVSTAVMGTRETLIDGEGCLIAEDDTDHFANCVTRLLDHPSLGRQLARRGPSHAARWGAMQKAAELAAFYADIHSHANAATCQQLMSDTSMADRPIPERDNDAGVTLQPPSQGLE